MNCQVDVIIIGDSKEGHEALKKIASAKNTTKVAFISREFKSTTTHDYLNVEYIKEEVIFTDYKNRLFGCYLKNGDRVYCTHLIIATGVKYLPFEVNNEVVPCVFNTLVDIPKTSKSQPAVVLCNKEADVKFALSVAKKYKYVYLCTEKFELENSTSATAKKLAETNNIVVLPNTTVAKVFAENGILQKVELSNYSLVTCSAIFVKTDSTPEVSFISDKLISKNATGHVEVNNIAESCVVPKCFIIGNCAKKSTKRMQQLMIDNVLNDFK